MYDRRAVVAYRIKEQVNKCYKLTGLEVEKWIVSTSAGSLTILPMKSRKTKLKVGTQENPSVNGCGCVLDRPE
ncbi:hypothetical protein OUZ56_028397 [Daphnia magna]|uniref:Uncharacterized protein n=1 Tax=Daphnia magna TaxID=35525 RepID=A0ABR0B3R4_9CRUS|nr:hypothetical protein OUZ56_028397 [Daphnia magna]